MSKSKQSKTSLKRSSRQLKRCLSKPAIHTILSIDNIAMTIPIPIKLVKNIYRTQSISSPDVTITSRDLDYSESLAQKYKKKFYVKFSNGSSLSIFCYGLNSKMNQVKIEFNPNTVGYENIDFVFCTLRNEYGKSEMLDWLQRAKVTSIHYAKDFPNIPFEHIAVDYSYSPKYKYFCEENTQQISTIRFGNKRGCPIIIYDKVLEQGGSYKEYEDYVRLEKQHRPQQRGQKSMFTFADIDKQRYSFQGFVFFDPMIFKDMPDKVLEKIKEYGISKAKDLLKPINKEILQRRMTKYRISQSADAKTAVITAFQSELSKLKTLILDK